MKGIGKKIAVIKIPQVSYEIIRRITQQQQTSAMALSGCIKSQRTEPYLKYKLMEIRK
jgi:hypothetical protein